MTNEIEELTSHQIDLLSREISSRIPYGLKVYCLDYPSDPKLVTGIDYSLIGQLAKPCVFLEDGTCYPVSEVKPYLRPLSEMTDLEWSELDEKIIQSGGSGYTHYFNETTVIPWIDFMLEHKFDYRGLIDMGLSIKATKEIYSNEEDSL